MRLCTYTQDKIQRNSYLDLQNQLKALYKDLSLSTSKEQRNYLEMEILVREEYLARVIERGRR